MKIQLTTCLPALCLLTIGGCASAGDPKASQVSPSQQGWWYLNAAPGFGIQEKVLQLEAGKPVLVWEDAGLGVSLAATSHSASKKVTWKFALTTSEAKANHLLRVTFDKPLAGMKFSVDAHAETGAESEKSRLVHRLEFADLVLVADSGADQAQS